MRARLHLAFIAIVAFLSTSCNFTENITIYEDGSGNMTMDMDASQLMALAGPELAKDGEKKMDTIIKFKDLLESKKDSIATLPKEEQEKLKMMENFTMKMVMDPAKQQFTFSMLNDFKKVSDLTDLMSSFDKANPMNSKKTQGMPDMGFDKYKTNTVYHYDGKKFKKTVSRAVELPLTESDSTEMLMAMFESSTYTVNYRFPKRVKKVSNKNATLSQDKKTVTIVYPFTDYLDKPKNMSLEVEFEK